MKTYNKQFISAQAMNVNSNSPSMELIQIFGYAIQIEISGTPTGTFKLQASADANNPPPTTGPNPINWTDIANSSQSVSATGNIMWDVANPMYNWVRVVYTDSSGGTATSTFNAVINCKGI